MSLEIPKHNFFGVSVSSFERDELEDYIVTTIKNKKKILYGYSLSIFRSIKNCPERIVHAEKSDVLVTDGRFFYLLAKWYKVPLKHEISIPSLVLMVLRLADRYQWGVFLLGAKEKENVSFPKNRAIQN